MTNEVYEAYEMGYIEDTTDPIALHAINKKRRARSRRERKVNTRRRKREEG